VEFDAGGFSVSPRATLNAVRTRVDGHEEQGAGARHRLAERSVGGVSGELAVRAEAGLSQGIRVHGEIGYREWLASDFDDVRVSLVDNPARELSVESEGEGGVLLDLGVGGPVAGRWTFDASYRGRLGDVEDSHAALLSVSMRY
jgi:uncharacterized protein with beta-barrel porin domain